MIFWYSNAFTDASTYLSTVAFTGVLCFCLTHTPLLAISGVGVRQVVVEVKRRSKADGLGTYSRAPGTVRASVCLFFCIPLLVLQYCRAPTIAWVVCSTEGCLLAGVFCFVCSMTILPVEAKRKFSWALQLK